MSCASAPTPEMSPPPKNWPGRWPTAGTSASCALAPILMTGTLTHFLAQLLADRGDFDELRARADTDDCDAAGHLARLLADQRDLDELRSRVGTGDEYAAYWLVELLADQKDLDELRSRSDARDWYAAGQLASILADCGNLYEAEQITRDLAVVGYDAIASYGISWRLADLLTRQRRHDEAERLRQFGLNPDGSTSSGHWVS